MLPKNEHTFHFKQQDQKTKEWYEGDFTFKCVLTIQEQMDYEIQAERYNQGVVNLSPALKLLNRVIAEIETRIVRKDGKPLCPTWWIESNYGWKLHDTEIIYAVFNEIPKAQAAWTDALKAKADETEKLAQEHPIKA